MQPVENISAVDTFDLAAQLELEAEMTDAGFERLLKSDKGSARRGDASAMSGLSYVVRHLLAPATAAAEEAMREPGGGNVTWRVPMRLLRGKLTAEQVALLVLRSSLNSLGRSKEAAPTLTSMGMDISGQLQLEMAMRDFRKADRANFERTLKQMRIREMDPEGALDIARKFAMHGRGVQPWAKTDCLSVGVRLLDKINTATGLFNLQLERRRSQTVWTVHLHPDARARALSAMEHAARMAPVLLPMVIPPMPWLSPYTGGYYSPPIQARYPLVKTESRALLQEMEGVDMSRVYAAINRAQDVAWTVNARVLATLTRSLEEQKPVGDIPDPHEPIAPISPEDAADPERLKDWKIEAAQIYERRVRARGQIQAITRAHELATRFNGQRIWFPHQLDFRGRMYPLPNTLNPQGPDVVKALLTFADTLPIETAEHAEWLAISGANHYGVDKVEFADRIAWVDTHTAMIRAVADDPFAPGAFEFWAAADAPWQFLAFCFEWDGYQREGFGYLCGLPVGLDGSCNGLQHYSAALRDEEGARHVNLLPSAKPADIYGAVAVRTMEHLQAFLNPAINNAKRFPWLAKTAAKWEERGINPRDAAQTWLGFTIARGITKRPVMTMPYGSTPFACKGFIEEALRKATKTTGNPFCSAFATSNERKAASLASGFLMPFVWQAIGETVHAARVCMDWLKECAGVASLAGCPITWRTPDGFMVQQAYRRTELMRVQTVMQGSVIRSAVQRNTLEIDDKRQAQGLPPNWVHSMDATALRMLVNEAASRGITSLALVHDSFGTQPSRAGELSRALRKSFADLYRDNDPVTDFYFDILEQVPDYVVQRIPAPPAKGSLDINLVEQAQYAFA